LTIRNDQEISSAGLYIGPPILGSVTANVMYSVACGRPGGFAGSLTAPLSLLFAIGAAILVVRIKNPIERAAFAILALYQSLVALSLVVAVPFIDRLGYPSLFAFAALLTVAGARSNPQLAKLMIPLLLTLMLVLSWVARYYGDQLMGKQSVFTQFPFC